MYECMNGWIDVYSVGHCGSLYAHICIDQLYPFGDAVGDAAVPSGISADITSPPLTLSPTFRFFGRDEDTIYVNLMNEVTVIADKSLIIFRQPF